MQISEALLLFAIYFHSSAGTTPKCPHEVVFQKILGLRPAQQGRNASSHPTTVLPLYAAAVATKSREEAVNVKCARICREDPVCYGYLLVFSQNTCYGYTSDESLEATARYDHIDENNYQLVGDVNVAFFVKTCLDVPVKCASGKLFPVVSIPGASLVGQNFQQLPKLVTRDDCINACLREHRFPCRSARFVHSFRNNRHRLWAKADKVQHGQCFLSRNDRFTHPESFKYGWVDDEEYVENQCHGLERTDARCSFEPHRDVAFIYADDSLIVSGEKSCSERCLNEDRFACLGYTYYNSSKGGGWPSCFLHSDDLTSLGPKAVRMMFDSVYAKRVSCLNLDAVCFSDKMEVDFEAAEEFRGRMYLNTVQPNCSTETMRNGTRVLEVTTGDEIVESRCGIRRAFIKGNVRNFLVFGYVYIQQHPVVRTQSDRLFKMGCIHHSESTNMTSLMDNLSMKSTVDFIPHSQSFSFGSTEVRNETSKVAKHVTTQLVDVETQAEVFEATLGQLIEMRIASTNRDFDLMPYDLVAYSVEETLPLVDSKGCPLDRRLFPGFRKQKTSSGWTLKARFHAFMFSSSTTLNFRLTIKFCYESCPKVVCFYQ